MERQLVRTAAGHVHLRLAGDASARPTVLLVHQSPSSSRMWVPVMELLAPAVRTCAIDLLGYGESDPPTRQLSLEKHAALLVGAVEAATEGPLVVVGHHTGAVVAAEIAGRRPDLVKGLLLSGYPLYPDWRTKLARLGAVLRPADISPDGTELLDIWRYVTGPLEAETDPQVGLTIMTDRLRAGREWFTAYVQLLGADLDQVLDDAATVAPGRPTTILTAEHDPLCPYADAVAARFGVDSTTVPGTSWVTYEHPDRVADPIVELLSRVRD